VTRTTGPDAACEIEGRKESDHRNQDREGNQRNIVASDNDHLALEASQEWKTMFLM
jgi:hypothetical protein